MEPYAAEKAEMIRLINEIMKYFNTYYDDGWKEFFEEMVRRCNTDFPFEKICGNIIRAYRGGMGSFQDYILEQDGKMPIEDNEKFDGLKDDLAQLCLDVLAESNRDNVVVFKQSDDKEE